MMGAEGSLLCTDERCAIHRSLVRLILCSLLPSEAACPLACFTSMHLVVAAC